MTAVPTDAAVLEVRGLSAGYDGIPVVRDLDLHVEPGEVVALLGPNGAGKTTTLLTVSGLLPALAGEVRVLGDRVSVRRPHRVARRGVAHVPEDRALFFGLSCSQNLRLGNRDRRGDVARPSSTSRSSAGSSTAAPGSCREASSRCSRSRARW